MDKEIQRIREFFEDINRPVSYILKNKYKNPKAELFDDKIELPKYAVIYKNEDLGFLGFENKIKELDILKFAEKNCDSLKGLLEELETEGYEIIYRI